MNYSSPYASAESRKTLCLSVMRLAQGPHVGAPCPTDRVTIPAAGKESQALGILDGAGWPFFPLLVSCHFPHAV